MRREGEDEQDSLIQEKEPYLIRKEHQQIHDPNKYIPEKYPQYEENQSPTYCCETRKITCITTIAGFMMILIVSCIIALFLVDDKIRNLVYGLITLFVCVLLSIVCCKGRNKNNKVVPQTIVHHYHVGNHFHPPSDKIQV